MFISSLKITLRSLWRDKPYALINLAGLALAITSSLVIGLYLESELTYDRHNVNHERIFRVANVYSIGGREDTFAATSMMLGPMLADDFAEVRGYVRFTRQGGERLIRHGDDAFYWRNVLIADDNVFDVFTHEVLYGDPRTALVDPSSAAVSETFARRYFGNANPIGETITIENDDTRQITLVFADLPENSHLKYDVLFSFNQPQLATPEDVTQRRQRLYNVSGYTYLLMPEDYDPRSFAAIAESFFERHMTEIGGRINATWRAWLQPLADVHLYSDVDYDEPTGNRYYLYGFMAVGVFILLVACINYMNLATARSAKRAKEVGLRKILGSGRLPLALQFLSESMLLSLAALALGVLLVAVVLNATPIGELLGKSLSLNPAEQPGLVWALLGLTLLIGIASGLYPAIYLSSIAPLSGLVSGAKGGAKGSRLREFLVLVQFTISIGVIACTLLMASQMRFIADQPLGFGKENRVLVTLRGQDLIDQFEVLENELEKNPRILGITQSASMMGQGFPINVAQLETNTGEMTEITINHMAIADDFLDVMDMSVVAGRGFSPDMLSDATNAVLVNEAAVELMAWEEPLGKRLQAGPLQGEVVGVVGDFNFRSLHTNVEPFAMYDFAFSAPPNGIPPQARPFQQRQMVLKVAGERIGETLRYIEDTLADFDGEHPFDYRFLDDTLDELYLSEQRLTRLIGIFAAICIFIACMGLFGLAAFSTEQRTKEIGVRKVLGASKRQIVGLLAKRTITLVVIGAAVAAIVAYFTMNAWLANFAYRTTINPLVFLVAAAVALAVAYATVALQALKAARAHPVHALRHE